MTDAIRERARINQRDRWAAVRVTDDVLVRVFRRDVHVVPVPDHTRLLTNIPPVWKGGGPISDATLRRMVHIIGDGPPMWASLLTLTYHLLWPTCGQCVARHLNALRTALYRYLGDFKYFWFWEYQERNAPHLHILLNVCPLGRYKRLSRGRRSWHEPHEWVSKRWQSIIGRPYATFRGRQAGCRWEAFEEPAAAAAYMSSYAKKLTQKQIPPGYLPPGSWWGRSHTLKDPEPLCETRMTRRMWRESMGPDVTSSRGTDYRVIHDGRRKILDAALRICGPEVGSPPTGAVGGDNGLSPTA